MNSHIISRLLTAKNKPLQWILSLTGTVLGLLIMMAGLQLWTDVRRLMQDKDMLGDDYIIISKQVSLLNTLGGGPGRFSDDELAEIKALKGIDAVGAFTPGKFRATMELSAEFGNFGGQLLKTELFFEAVPDRFMDIGAGAWNWKPGDATVPIVVPADILQQYNHAFAASQGLPVVPESMLTGISFDLHLQGRDKKETLRGRIAGFSRRINSILVPQAFLDYGNRTYAEAQPPRPSRLILHSTQPAAPELIRFFQDKGYELNEEKLRAGRTQMLLQLVMLLVALLGAFIVLLAMLGFVQYTQLLAYRSAYEIQTLHWLGYPTREIRQPYDRLALKTLIWAICLALVAFGLYQWALWSLFESKGFNLSLHGWKWAIPAGIICTALMLLFSKWQVKKQVETLALQ